METDVQDRWEVEVHPALHIGRLSKEMDKATAEVRYRFAERFGYVPDEVVVGYNRRRDVFSIEAQGTGIDNPVRRRHVQAGSHLEQDD